MSRPRTKTAYLDPMIQTAITNLWGKAKAFRLLQLEAEGLDYRSFVDALNNKRVTPENRDMIEHCYRQWASKYLKHPDRLSFGRIPE